VSQVTLVTSGLDRPKKNGREGEQPDEDPQQSIHPTLSFAWSKPASTFV